METENLELGDVGAAVVAAAAGVEGIMVEDTGAEVTLIVSLPIFRATHR